MHCDLLLNHYYVKSVQIQSFFWFVFSCIWAEYGGLLRKSSYSVRIQENTDQEKFHIWTLSTQCILCCHRLDFIRWKIGIYRISHTFITAWKVSKYGVISGPYFPVFGLNTGKYGPEKTPYLDTFTQFMLFLWH